MTTFFIALFKKGSKNGKLPKYMALYLSFCRDLDCKNSVSTSVLILELLILED